MASKALYSVVAVVGIAAAGGTAWWYQNKPMATQTEPGGAAAGPQGAASAPVGAGGGGGGGGRPAVEVAKVEAVKLTDDNQSVGSLRSRQSVVLRPEVSGRITQLNFRDGDRVKKGQVLVQFDDQLPQAQVQQALAELSIAQANFKRNQELVEQNFISRRTVDESAANLQVAEAKLALARATAARLRLVAPFDGLAGIRNVNIGDYLKDGADIVNIEDIEAIYVDYRLPERFQTKVRRGQKAAVELDALPGRKFTATVQAVDPLIEPNGRSVGVRACIDNRRLQLRPGMFARVNTVFGERENARVVPEEAIVPQAGKQFVIKLVDGPDGQSRITQRVEVKVGVRSPGKVEILEGVEVGDTVVVAGQQRLQREGTAVRVVDVSAGAGRQGGGAAGAAGGAGAAAAPAQAASAAAGAPVLAPAGQAGPASPAPAANAANAAAAAAPAKPLPPLVGPDPCLVAGADAGAAGRGADRPGRAAPGGESAPAERSRKAAPEASPAGLRIQTPA